MNVRDRLRDRGREAAKKTKEVARERGGTVRERLSEVDRAKLAKAVRAASAAGSGASQRPSGSSKMTAEERRMFANAEESATVAGPIDATLDPTTAPEQTGWFAMGRQGDGSQAASDADMMGVRGEPTVDEMVYSSGDRGRRENAGMGLDVGAGLGMGIGVGVGVGLGFGGFSNDQDREKESDGWMEFDDPLGFGGDDR